MPEGGELLVRVRRMGNQVELSITDTGVGMTPEKLARCFEEYWSDKPGGTGLGLSTARRIIEEHGGTITALSELGRGSSFSCYLPLAVELVRGEDGEHATTPVPDAPVEEEEETRA
jgi:signal transduction histidine kinase